MQTGTPLHLPNPALRGAEQGGGTPMAVGGQTTHGKATPSHVQQQERFGHGRNSIQGQNSDVRKGDGGNSGLAFQEQAPSSAPQTEGQK